jgi:hypothetical protein
MRAFSSSQEATRMWRRKVRAIFPRGFGQVQPGAVRWCEHIVEPVRARSQVVLSLFGKVRGVVIENEPDVAFRRIVTVQVLQQRNEFNAAAASLDTRDDMAVVQVQSRGMEQVPSLLYSWPRAVPGC